MMRDRSTKGLLRRKSTARDSDGAPTTRSASTRAASRAFASGTTTPSSPARAAAMATARIPGVGISVPFSESSPENA